MSNLLQRPTGIMDFEVWNKPYRYGRSDGCSDLVWLNEMIGIRRNTDNRNIILVPCVGKNQDKSVLINKENEFLTENRIYFLTFTLMKNGY